MRQAVLLSFGLFLSAPAFASVSRCYHVAFRGDYGTSAETEKQIALRSLPAYFGQYVPDVSWTVVKKRTGSFDVRLTAENSNRIDGWLYCLRSGTQDSLAEVRKLPLAQCPKRPRH
jgi:hypothetical protein